MRQQHEMNFLETVTQCQHEHAYWVNMVLSFFVHFETMSRSGWNCSLSVPSWLDHIYLSPPCDSVARIIMPKFSLSFVRAPPIAWQCANQSGKKKQCSPFPITRLDVARMVSCILDRKTHTVECAWCGNGEWLRKRVS